MANAVVKLADTISEIHQMLRIERARADSLMVDNFTLKIKNHELEILIEKYPWVSKTRKQDNIDTDTKDDRNPFNSYQRSRKKSTKQRWQDTMHKESEINATKQSEETQRANKNINRGVSIERYRTQNGKNTKESNRVPYNTTATK